MSRLWRITVEVLERDEAAATTAAASALLDHSARLLRAQRPQMARTDRIRRIRRDMSLTVEEVIELV